METTIVKAGWLTARTCKRKAWLEMREESEPLSEGDRFRIEQGREIGELARGLFPSGHLVTTQDGRSPVELTQDLLAENSTETLFEPAFLSRPFITRADIITRRDGKWHLLEVKSSFADTPNFERLIDDVAYTALVIGHTGLTLETISLMLLSRDFRFGDGPERLFEIVDVSPQVRTRVEEFARSAEAIAELLLSDTPPTPVLVSGCRSCSFFANQCLGKGLTSTVLEIPSLQPAQLQLLSARGIVDLSLAPDDLNLNESQGRAKYSALSGNFVSTPNLSSALNSIVWPCHYLDFETVAAILPLYEGQGCHQQVVTQVSVHRRESPEAELWHTEYLADASRESERNLAETLIQVLFDLLPIVRDNVYHPGFRGSFSIKAVVPALIPDLSYEGLNVSDGAMASTKFAKMACGRIVEKDIEKTRRDLLAYCKVDTFALVRLHEDLSNRAARRRGAGST
jgi:CRISPR/Cas system-associated exonuclease Cas4 (RecB family)